MAMKQLPAEVAADRAAAMTEYLQDQRSALTRMEAQRAARLQGEVKDKTQKDRP